MMNEKISAGTKEIESFDLYIFILQLKLIVLR